MKKKSGYTETSPSYKKQEKNSGPKEKEEEKKKTKSNHITHIKEETIIKFQLKQLQWKLQLDY